jgi:hypothetical protein
MMTLKDLLRDNKDAVVERWLEDVLATYPGDAGAAFRRQKDPFANPVGHSLRTGTLRVFESLLDGIDDEKVRHDVGEIIKIRAVQQFSASQAVSFVFQLKAAIRAQLGAAAEDPKLAAELVQLEEQIDQIALAAFDVFVHCREQVYELRVNELKRNVSWVVERMNRRGNDPEIDLDPSAMKTPESANGQREGVQ